MPALPAEVPLAGDAGGRAALSRPVGKRARAGEWTTRVYPVVAAPSSDRLAPVPARQALSRWWTLLLRRYRNAEVTWTLFLGLISLLSAMGMYEWPDLVPLVTLIVPMVLANSALGPRTLPWFVVFTLGLMVIVIAATAADQLDGRRIGAIMVSFTIGLIILVSSFRRSQLGVAGARGESMLVDLRDRISKQGHLPGLPDNWYAESVTRSAGASSFAGDFMVASLSRDHDRFQVVVVDVSGKGEQAGTRSLLLSGAFGGLLGAMPAGGLPAGRQRLPPAPGLARRVRHRGAPLDLASSTGDFEIRSAGHPPAVQMQAGSGRWAIHEAEGPILGLMADAEFTTVTGRINSGDALLMYTDGLVETPTPRHLAGHRQAARPGGAAAALRLRAGRHDGSSTRSVR